MTRLHYFIIALSIVAVNPNSSQAAKPPPPPPPPPTPASCPGTFPAYAYTKDVTKKQGSKVILLSTELYLANSTGTCSIKIANPVSQNGLSQIGLINYRQNGTGGRIVFESNTGLGMVNFIVDAGTVTTALPLTISNVYGSLAWHTYTLSKNGQTIYMVDEVRDSNGNWIDTIRTVDIASCSSNCPAQVLHTFPLGNNAYHLSLNDAEDRLYMSFHDFGLDRALFLSCKKQPVSGRHHVAMWSATWTVGIRVVGENSQMAMEF